MVTSIRIALLFSIYLCGATLGSSQDYFSYIAYDDTLSESGNDLIFFDDEIYSLSLKGCQPFAQTCGGLRKLNHLGELDWQVDLPDSPYDV